jgi:hypothetical protein
MSAANGSLDDIAKLHSLIPDVPHAQLRLFISAFYANLNTSDISDLRRQLDTNFSVVQIRISKTILALKGCLILRNTWCLVRVAKFGPRRGPGFDSSRSARNTALAELERPAASYI